MSNKIEGEIIKVGDMQVFDSGFQKREFVVRVPGEYPNNLKFEVFKDRAQGFSYKVGDYVSVDFNIKGSEYHEKYYVNLQAWKIEKANKPQQQVVNVATGEVNDLPF